ncbi:hypothetical protein CsSME_00051323 [Camellia sinensis var. sinensis]
MAGDGFLPFSPNSSIGFGKPNTLENSGSSSENTVAEAIAMAITYDDVVAPPPEVIIINSDDDEDRDELDKYFNNPYPSSRDFGANPSDGDDGPGGVGIS